MDVRCERCNAQYTVDDGLVHEGGLAVRCAMCGHSFKVMKSQGWSFRKASGDVYPLPDSATLQRWVVEGRVTRDDEVAQPGRPWVKAGELKDLAPFFAVVDQARRARSGPGSGPEPSGTPAPVRDRASGSGELSLGSSNVPVDQWQAPTRAPLDAQEPAWATGPAAAPAQGTARKPRPAAVAKQKSSPRRRWPLLVLGFVVLVVLGVAAGAAAFYALKPDAVPPALGKLFRAWNPWASDSAESTTNAPRPLAPGTPGARPPPQPPVPDVPAPTPPPRAAPVPPPPPPAPAVERAPEPAPPPSAPAESQATAPTPPPSAPAESQAMAPTPSPAVPGAAPAAPSPQPPATSEPKTPPPAEPAPTASEPRAAPPAKAMASTPAPRARAEAVAPARKAEAPKRATSLIAQGRYLRDSGRASAALDVYARALQSNPDNADALAGRGLAYLDLSSYRQAEESFRAALAVDGSHPSALMGLAETYRYQGKRADAVALYRKYLAEHPKGEDATAARKAVQSLEESP